MKGLYFDIGLQLMPVTKLTIVLSMDQSRSVPILCCAVEVGVSSRNEIGAPGNSNPDGR
jgi:hypothetical protein